MNSEHINQRIEEPGNALVADLKPEGYWEGQLSSSALAVAVAIVALYFDNKELHKNALVNGLQWLHKNINTDGSYGDSPESPGNVSTSLLTYAALNLFRDDEQVANTQAKIAGYLGSKNIDVQSKQVAQYILDHYKKDYTFSVPILTLCGLCNVPGPDAFDHIPQLPFELSLLPRRFYRLLNLSVVSYAIPALVAVGIVIFKQKKSNLFWRIMRKLSISKAMRKLEQMMPESGGFLEAIPLTAFVGLSLMNSGYENHPVVKKGVKFLLKTQRSDGSWPIDIDLSTWVTTLSIKGFRSQVDQFLSPEQKGQIVAHLKNNQLKHQHPFNGTSAGGWGWTNHSGSVPDGDDTSGTIITLVKLQPETVKDEVLNGLNWLTKLQNNDGGLPTFSRGWGKLPFDQSCADITAHGLLACSTAMEAYKDDLTCGQNRKLTKSFTQLLKYLEKHQHADGSWLPLWFGNQYTDGHKNPVYGTARVVAYLSDALQHTWLSQSNAIQIEQIIEKGRAFLIKNQNYDGSWGGSHGVNGTIEETSLAVAALAISQHTDVCEKGLEWLDKFYNQHGLTSSPIGLYFASLWYDEKLYPVTAYLEALTRVNEIQS